MTAETELSAIEAGLAGRLEAVMDLMNVLSRLGVTHSVDPRLVAACGRVAGLTAPALTPCGLAAPTTSPSTSAAATDPPPSRSEVTMRIESIVAQHQGQVVKTSLVLSTLEAEGWTTDSPRPTILISSALGRLADDPSSPVTRVARGSYRWEPLEPHDAEVRVEAAAENTGADITPHKALEQKEDGHAAETRGILGSP